MNKIFIFILIAFLCGGFIGYWSHQKKILGAAPPGLSSFLATSSEIHLPGKVTARQLFATSTSCQARIITTKTSPILLAFGDSVATPTPQQGHLQVASSTVVYDSQTYGCGTIKALPADDGTTIITITEMR